MTAQKKMTCPKCNGSGDYNYPNGSDRYGKQAYFRDTCDRCDGRTKVDFRTIQQDKEDQYEQQTVAREYGV